MLFVNKCFTYMKTVVYIIVAWVLASYDHCCEVPKEHRYHLQQQPDGFLCQVKLQTQGTCQSMVVSCHGIEIGKVWCLLCSQLGVAGGWSSWASTASIFGGPLTSVFIYHGRHCCHHWLVASGQCGLDIGSCQSVTTWSLHWWLVNYCLWL